MDKLDQTPQAQEVNSQMPAPVSKSNNTKLLILILAGVAIVLAIGAYVLGTKQSQPVVQNSVQATPIIPSPTTADETANWKIFNSNTNGVSFKYPASITPYENANTINLYYKQKGSPDGCELCDGYMLRLTKGSLGKKELKTFVSEKAKVDSEWISKPITSITIAGYSGITYSIVREIAGDYIYISDNDGNYIEIIKNFDDPQKRGYKNILNQILSTFRFSN